MRSNDSNLVKVLNEIPEYPQETTCQEISNKTRLTPKQVNATINSCCTEDDNLCEDHRGLYVYYSKLPEGYWND